jgi:hypothetical protein
MVLINMNTTLKILFLLTLVISFSCEDQGLFVRCPDCFEDEPVKTTLEIKLENHTYYPNAVIQIWEGNLEDNVLFKTITINAYSSTFSQEVTLNKKYTITATYYYPADTYIAVDSATPSVKYEKTQCDKPCYFVYDKVIDLRLKYTK